MRCYKCENESDFLLKGFKRKKKANNSYWYVEGNYCLKCIGVKNGEDSNPKNVISGQEEEKSEDKDNKRNHNDLQRSQAKHEDDKGSTEKKR